ncbi:hypothetical protein HNR32_000681 [Pectinatus brassicae]|uniref:Uncharacterized protein n=1 Tax=Pectinatus brassicae TaxID=862415 RepID=A0A840URU8_9FIRM|nr:hypothetical protein [Pectinatus brassicae]
MHSIKSPPHRSQVQASYDAIGDVKTGSSPGSESSFFQAFPEKYPVA